MSDNSRPDADHARATAVASTETSVQAFVTQVKALRESSTRAGRMAKQQLSALITGGTAPERRKAAEAAAKAAGAALLAVDLNAISSKYIGETEKSIDAVFKDAERSGSVLYIDEADALLGKRTDVKDAHDRYANLEVGYLLRRIEAHPGIAILSTNLKTNIDPAIRKRLRYFVELP